jgi:SAM-dependent methyltransferase
VSRHALLVSPAANRVYSGASVGLTVAELGVAALGPLGGRVAGIEATTIAGVPYVSFEMAEEPTGPDLGVLGLLSSAHALFAVSDTGVLRPVQLPRPDVLDDDLITIPKYQGKTNEHFTRLLLNVTLLSATPSSTRRARLKLLDPLCGRGTTLNQALVYGFDAAGIDADGNGMAAYATFLRTWLQRKRIKHRLEFSPVRENRRVVARRLHATLTPPSTLPSGGALELTAYAADTVEGMRFFRPDSVDLVVTDAPYGVQHGSRTAGRGLDRGPVGLLAAAVPGWSRALRPGGAMGIAWNANVADRAEIAAVLAGAGLTVLAGPPYAGFRHRVDQAIVRDLIVAKKAADLG